MKTQWFPIETAPFDYEPFDVWNGHKRYVDCSIGRPTYRDSYEKPNKIIYKDSYDCDGPVYEEVKGATHWSRFTPPEGTV